MKIEVKQISDNNPGYVKQYEPREVDQGVTYQISVNIDGECNHADYDIEEDTVESYNPDETDSVRYTQFEVCNKCKAYREVGEDEWRGITVMPL